MHDRKWQYRVESVKTGAFSSPQKNDEIIQERLQRLGMDGWELVNVVVIAQYMRLFLKR